MDKVIGIGFLAGGIVLMVFGVQGMNSVSSDVSKFFTGAPTDKAVWMLVGGAVLAGIGLIMTLRSSRIR